MQASNPMTSLGNTYTVMNEKELSLCVDPQLDKLSPAQLYEDAIRLRDGEIASNRALIGPRADHRANCFPVV